MDFFAFFTIIHGIDTKDKIMLCRIMVKSYMPIDQKITISSLDILILAIYANF